MTRVAAGVALLACRAEAAGGATDRRATDGAAADTMPVFEELQARLQIGIDGIARGDTSAYVAASREVHGAAPLVPAFAFHFARALALRGEVDSALRILSPLASEGALMASGFPSDSAFARFRSTPEFQRAVAAYERTRQPISNAEPAFEVADTLLIPEGTAFDARTGDVLLGSINRRKVIRHARDGTVGDVIPSASHGLGGVGGIEIDAERRHLWAVSVHVRGHPSAGTDSAVLDAGVLYKFDVDKGTFLARYVVPASDSQPHGFNDVTVLPNGDAYTTDNRAGAIYVVRASNGSVEAVFPPRSFTFPNGIAHSEDGATLFIAHAHGVDAVRLRDRTRWRLAAPDSLNIAGFDGLTFTRHALIGHQPSSYNRVVLLRLSDDLRSVVSRVILERHHPRFSQPTTGALGNDGYYYFIANAQMRRFRERSEPLDRTLILRVKVSGLTGEQ